MSDTLIDRIHLLIEKGYEPIDVGGTVPDGLAFLGPVVHEDKQLFAQKALIAFKEKDKTTEVAFVPVVWTHGDDKEYDFMLGKAEKDLRDYYKQL